MTLTLVIDEPPSDGNSFKSNGGGPRALPPEPRIENMDAVGAEPVDEDRP